MLCENVPQFGEHLISMSLFAKNPIKIQICVYFMFQGLEYCEERYTLDLTEGTFPLTGQTNTKLLGCQSIEKFRSHGDREESMNEGCF